MGTLGGSAAAINDVQIPPIRTNLNDPLVTNQTAKEWYFYWKQSGDRINTLNGMVAYGNSFDRLDPGTAPDGAIYVEQDRTGVIYQAQGGEWHYLAGTMYGTLSPDQRPTDLGPNDAGFEFRSTDSDPNYAPRQFLWSGHEWIETTLVLYGLHAARPAADEKTPPRTIYVETDRSGVIYQQQANAWHYLAGAMWGTLVPSQVPGDLGANDAGFTFRTVDTSPAFAGRTLVWSGSLWVETTAARFDTHANRIASPVSNIENGTLWVETDRSEVIYQLQGSTWHFLAGTMWGTISPDGRPTDLGANDAGFAYRGTDQQREFIWSGSVWIEYAQGLALIAYASANLNLTTSNQNVPGAALTLSRAGTWLITGSFQMIAANDPGIYLVGTLSGQGIGAIYMQQGNSSQAMASQQWIVTVSAGATAQLVASKSGGTGTSQTGTYTSISAVWISP